MSVDFLEASRARIQYDYTSVQTKVGCFAEVVANGRNVKLPFWVAIDPVRPV